MSVNSTVASTGRRPGGRCPVTNCSTSTSTGSWSPAQGSSSPRELHETRRRDPIGDVAPRLEDLDPVVDPVEDEGRAAWTAGSGGCRSVAIGDGSPDHVGARRLPHITAPTSRGDARRHQETGEQRDASSPRTLGPPPFGELSVICSHSSIDTAGKVVGRHPGRRDRVERERGHAVRKRRGEDAQTQPESRSEDRRASRPDRVEDDNEVVHHDLERRKILGRHAIGKTRAPPVHQNQPRERGQPAQEQRVRRALHAISRLLMRGVRHAARRPRPPRRRGAQGRHRAVLRPGRVHGHLGVGRPRGRRPDARRLLRDGPGADRGARRSGGEVHRRRRRRGLRRAGRARGRPRARRARGPSDRRGRRGARGVGGAPLRLRVGINTGEALVRLGVAPGSGERFLAGDAINTASRLQSVAPEMGVAVGLGDVRGHRGGLRLRGARAGDAQGQGRAGAGLPRHGAAGAPRHRPHADARHARSSAGRSTWRS